MSNGTKSYVYFCLKNDGLKELFSFRLSGSISSTPTFIKPFFKRVTTLRLRNNKELLNKNHRQQNERENARNPAAIIIVSYFSFSLQNFTYIYIKFVNLQIRMSSFGSWTNKKHSFSLARRPSGRSQKSIVPATLQTQS